MTTPRTCPPTALKHLPANGVIIDVRTDMEHNDQHLSCAHLHIPLDQVSATVLRDQYNLAQDRPLYMLCKGGVRAAQAAQKLAAEGYANIHVIEGGLTNCTAQGVATTRTQTCQTRISLERQVRIAAGALVVLGTLFGLFADRAFFAVPLVIGGGLVFAGITDRCGLALLIAKAPWNRV